MLRLLGFLVCLVWIGSAYAQDTDIQVNSDRLQRNMRALAELDEAPKETKRIAVTETTLNGRAFIMSLMREAGLKVWVDYAGNIVGTRAGWNPANKPISIGSRMNTMKEQGDYEGYISSLAAVEVIQTFMDHDIFTDHPLEIIIFTDEEDGISGSQAVLGDYDNESLKSVNARGITREEGIIELGGDPKKLDKLVRPKGAMAAFVELHADPIGILERNNIDIGVVDRIIDKRSWDIRITGLPTHAGITGTELRNETLMAASNLYIKLKEITGSYDSRPIGLLSDPVQAEKNPEGRVTMNATLSISDSSIERINEIYMLLKQSSYDIAHQEGVEISFKQVMDDDTDGLIDPTLQRVIDNAASTLGLSTRKVQSGTEYDAGGIASIAPTAMIFLPAAEASDLAFVDHQGGDDIANGANVLLLTLLALDKELQKDEMPVGGN
ncbi:hydantoinase/carbamoylase family amidase [Aureitalea marina]|uniref:Peptidase M20 dimerisation domain-containing protein n=1 Tax=Aureitalea marina TaxID=930804 RepID=A0A2S7KQ50_9FLAO|nr:hydantoinase/carbamoylase family amidase [Aureitalea marina]PQB04740.1 hypothetical protein BST85_07410 [Aureitalea marina]